MKIKNVGYHTRLCSDGTKVCGGSFGGSVDLETVNRLVNAHLEVKVRPSGTPVFVDRNGREVWLYLTVDPRMTTKGVEALKVWNAERVRLEEAAEEREAEWRDELADAMVGLSREDILRRLRGE